MDNFGHYFLSNVNNITFFALKSHKNTSSGGKQPCCLFCLFLLVVSGLRDWGERHNLLGWTFQLDASLDIALIWDERMSEHPFNAVCKNPVLLLGRFRLVKSLSWYINHLCMCVLKLFKAFSIRNASLLISTNSLTQNVFLNSQKGSFCPAFKYEKCGFKFTFHLEMRVIMNPSCLGFAFQFSVTDFKSPAEASARTATEDRAITGQSLESEKGVCRERFWG